MRAIKSILILAVAVAALAWLREPTLDRFAVILASSAGVLQATHPIKAIGTSPSGTAVPGRRFRWPGAWRWL